MPAGVEGIRIAARVSAGFGEMHARDECISTVHTHRDMHVRFVGEPAYEDSTDDEGGGM